MPHALLERPLKALAAVLAAVAKLSALHPIHTLLVTSFLASISYLSIVREYVSDGLLSENGGSQLQSFYRPAKSEGGSNEWFQLSQDELAEITALGSGVSRYDVVPFQFKRVGNLAVPEIAGTVTDDQDPHVLLLISDSGENAEKQAIEMKQLIATDGTVWKYRGFHSKLHKYSDFVLKYCNSLWNLIQGAEKFDIAIVTAAYTAMWYTFISLFFEMRKSGSKFWIAVSALVSSFFAFLFGLHTTTIYFNLEIPIVSLSEGLPFLVATIGFKHKTLLTKKVLTKYSRKEFMQNSASDSIYYAVKDESVSLLRDHLLVVLAFVGCSLYATHLKGLHNFCILAASILVFDVLTTVTFFAAILSLKLEINDIHNSTLLKQALQEDGLDKDSINNILKGSSEGKPYDNDEKNTLLTFFKVLAISAFIIFHLYGFGSVWLYDLNSVSELDENPTFGKLVLSKIPVSQKGTVVSLYPARFFLPSKVSIQIEDLILTGINHISAGIRDGLISKFLLFAFTISISINIYLFKVARFHSSNVKSEFESDKPTLSNDKSTKSVDIVSKTEGIDENDSNEEVTKSSEIFNPEDDEVFKPHEIRPLDTLVGAFKDGKVKTLYDDEVVSLVTNSKLPLYALEKQLGDKTRAVAIRRKAISKLANAPVLETNKLPYLHYDYDRVFGACCENVIGYVPIPVGIAGPLIIDGRPYHIPMATTEGCLVASAMRGCKAINLGGGVETVLTKDGMTRGPCVQFPSLTRAGACKIWLDSEEGQNIVKKAFNSTSRFARLQHIQTALAGTLLFIRFRTTTGDAMGMNMISKGVEFSLKQMVEEFGWDDMEVISVSGNYCTDKKPAAINWIEGRGKSVVAESIVPKEVVEKVLKSNVKALVELNIDKNLIGSAMAGSVGGFNAHAANILTAVYLALGQDPAQNVESSNCITLMKENKNGDLQISVSMPSIEVGTIGGGTILDPQGSMLELLGVRGPATVPGDNARQLAKIIAGIVLAGELSLCSALAAGHLVQSHMVHNRAGAKK